MTHVLFCAKFGRGFIKGGFGADAIITKITKSENKFLIIRAFNLRGMQYKVVYRPYDLTSLIGNAKGKSGTYEATCETGDWNIALNKYAKDGWKVKNTGTIESSRDVMFWALLEKE